MAYFPIELNFPIVVSCFCYIVNATAIVLSWYMEGE